MTFSAINLAFPFVLSIHNFDEFARYDEFSRAFNKRLPAKLVTRTVIRNAAILLPISTALLALSTYRFNDVALLALSKIAIFAALLNAISHCIVSLQRRALMPGTGSAAALVLPYGCVAIAFMRKGCGNSWLSLLGYAGSGVFLVPFAVLTFLWMGYGLSRLTAPEH